MNSDLKEALDERGVGGSEFHTNKILGDLNEKLREV